VQIRRTGYPPKSKTFATKAEAEKWAIINEANVLNNKTITSKSNTKLKISEVIDWYIKNPNKQRVLKTKKHFNRLYFLKEEFEHFTVGSLTAKILQKWIDKRLEINEPSTVYHYYVALKNVLEHHGIQHGYSQEIFNLAKCPTGSNQRERRFSRDETAKLFKTIKHRCRVKQKELKLTILFAIETACRIGEMLKLEWNEVDIKNQEVTFLAKNTKTKKTRKVPISSTARKILQWIKKHHNPENKRNKRVFDFYDVSEHQLSRQFKICCDKAEIHDIRWHDLRHEGTSRFYEKGKNLSDMEISTITGHASLNSLKRYAHLRPSSILHKLW
jgi:integrase